MRERKARRRCKLSSVLPSVQCYVVAVSEVCRSGKPGKQTLRLEPWRRGSQKSTRDAIYIDHQVSETETVFMTGYSDEYLNLTWRGVEAKISGLTGDVRGTSELPLLQKQLRVETCCCPISSGCVSKTQYEPFNKG